MWARRTRVLVLGAVLTVGLLATVLLQSPVPTQTVDELMASPSSHLDEEVAVRGEVQDGSIDNETKTFVLEGVSSTLSIRFTDAMVSNGLDDNRTVYAEGTLFLEDGVYYLDAHTIKTSCPSKYEEANE
ncbi:MAG: cytochrome c maturation protein CcmE [Poseidonia sp.]